MAGQGHRELEDRDDIYPEGAKPADATDDEGSSDDEAPEQVSTAAAAALAGQRRKAEQRARQASAAPKRKRARSSKGGKNASEGDGGKGMGDGRTVDGEDDGIDDGGLELPSDLLLQVKSRALERMEADAKGTMRREAQKAEDERAAREANGRKGKISALSLPRSDNLRLVVLDKDDAGSAGVADSSVQALEKANAFLRDRRERQKRVSHTVFKARTRLGPAPNF